MGDVFAVLKTSGLPVGLVCAIALAIYLAKEFKLFERAPPPPPVKSREEILSQSEENFRRALMDELEAMGKRLDASDEREDELRKSLAECERTHLEQSRKFDGEIAEVREEVSGWKERYATLHGCLQGILAASRRAGLMLLMDTTDTAPMPDSVDDLLKDIEPQPHQERRFMAIPVTNDRRKRDQLSQPQPPTKEQP